MTRLLDRLPARWQADRLLREEATRWADAGFSGDERGVLVRVETPRGVVLRGAGDPQVVSGLVALAAAGATAPAAWMSVPRGTVVEADVLAGLGLAPFSQWDWLSTDAESFPAPAADERVVVLDPSGDAADIRACLAEANPQTSADPEGPDERAWLGARDGAGALIAVIGAAGRATPDGEVRHLHGLGVRPDARTAGLGLALTAAATAAGLEAGAPWVSLGMYEDNVGARRIYHRLGFAIGERFSSYGPAAG